MDIHEKLEEIIDLVYLIDPKTDRDLFYKEEVMELLNNLQEDLKKSSGEEQEIEVFEYHEVSPDPPSELDELIESFDHLSHALKK